MACLAKEPAQRPQSALAVTEWIGAAVTPQPSFQALSNDVSAEAQPAEDPASAPESEPAAPAPSNSRRNRLWPVAAAAILVLTVAGLYWAAHRTPKNLQTTAKSQSTAQPSAKEGGSALADKASVPFSGELPGTTWTVTDSDGEHYSFQFAANGFLTYEGRRGVQPNGRWQQDGGNISIDINNGYTIFSGTISGAAMSGNAVSREGKTWNWKAAPKS